MSRSTTCAKAFTASPLRLGGPPRHLGCHRSCGLLPPHRQKQPLGGHHNHMTRGPHSCHTRLGLLWHKTRGLLWHRRWCHRTWDVLHMTQEPHMTLELPWLWSLGLHTVVLVLRTTLEPLLSLG